MKNFDEILDELDACSYAKEWAEGKDFETIWTTCHRGDWMGWLVDELKIDKQLRVLVAGHCANTVRYLMIDERSTNAIDVAIRYGNGEATEEELAVAREAARDGARASVWAISGVMSAASAAASDAVCDAAWAAANAAARTASDEWDAAAWWDYQLQTANIIRQHITFKMMTLSVNISLLK